MKTAPVATIATNPRTRAILPKLRVAQRAETKLSDSLCRCHELLVPRGILFAERVRRDGPARRGVAVGHVFVRVLNESWQKSC